MLRLVTGPFHPTLESALVHDLQVMKAHDPLAGVALVVPSDQLRRSLKRLLALTHDLSLLNVHIFSFHQLALHLDRERLVCESLSGKTTRRIALVTDVFFEQLVQHLGQRNVPQTEALRLSQLHPGAWAALWASLRDLKDATMDSAVVLRAVEEEQFDPEDREKLKGLFILYAALQESRAALGVGSPDDLAALVTDFVPVSPFLRSLTRICYYGSYDLTQTQLTLVEALSAAVPVTIYFPLDQQPAYEFARQFLERHLYPLAGGSEDTAPAAPDDAVSHHERKANVSVEVRNTAGIEDELTLVCKQILSLVETNGYAFDEIGVVGRTLVPYQTVLKRTFDQHRIPFVSTATLPLLQEPAVKALLHLAQLKGSRLYQPPMLDVLTSPWNRQVMSNTGSIEPRPDLWRIAVQMLGITRGEEEWRRLAKLGRLDSWGTDDEEFTASIGPLSIDGGQLRLLWHCVSRLIGDVNGLPDLGGYRDLTDAFLSLADKHLSVPLGASLSIDPGSLWEAAADVNEALTTVFTQLRELDRLDVTITWDEWTETFMQVLERTTYAVAPFSHRGVQVLDAMAARGVGFRALFMVGMNEKLFPRFIHEDGFLRDRHRLILSQTLGYKIDQKLQGYGEEALLFELLRSSATERVYLSYQRADAAGRPLVPSTYLDTAGGRLQSSDPESLFALPRRWPERAALALFAPPLLTREELTISRVLEGRDVSALLEAVGRDGHLFSHGLEAQQVIESEQPALNAYDGMLQNTSSHWSTVSRRGFSPTALESYARCPFQYFAGQALELKSVRQMPSMELSPPAMGHLCHEALRLCYLVLIQQGWP
ncbi:MAG: PD-(D/E)XK nuclease family protein, partial [Nitrospira sp.]|nr:PD-(D/E)XK nuclease family protein [Nitrospira sp.]